MNYWQFFLLFLFTFKATITNAQTYLVNKEHSLVKFSIPYMKLLEVEGNFKDYRLFFELEGNFVKSVEGQIIVSSIDTNDKKRDDHLSKNDFFDANRFPVIQVSLNKNKPFNFYINSKINLDLKIKDITKTVEFDYQYLGSKEDPWTKVSGHYFKLSGKINRKEFNIVWNKKLDNEEGFVIGDIVTIQATAEAYQSNEKPAFSRFYKEKIGNTNVADANTNSSISKNTQAEISNESSTDLSKAQNNKTNKSEESSAQYSSGKNIFITLISGFIIFIFIILFGIYGQKYLVDFFEKKNVNDSWTFIISSAIIMIAIIIISIYVAPLMGFGINPITNFLK